MNKVRESNFRERIKPNSLSVSVLSVCPSILYRGEHSVSRAGVIKATVAEAFHSSGRLWLSLTHVILHTFPKGREEEKEREMRKERPKVCEQMKGWKMEMIWKCSVLVHSSSAKPELDSTYRMRYHNSHTYTPQVLCSWWEST